MSYYLKYLKSMYDEETIARKREYLNYNFGVYLKPNSKVLEIGPGIGEFIGLLNEKSIKNIDIADNDKEILEYIKNKFKINKTYLISEARDLEKKLSSYDVIFLLQVLEHVPKDQQHILIKTLYKHLNKNGVILITVPNGGNPLSIVERYSDFTHELLFSENSFKELVYSLNEKDIMFKIQGYKIPPSNLINLIRILLQKLLHLFLKFLLILNGGVYFNIYHPNITLVIIKK